MKSAGQHVKDLLENFYCWQAERKGVSNVNQFNCVVIRLLLFCFVFRTRKHVQIISAINFEGKMSLKINYFFYYRAGGVGKGEKGSIF